MTRLSGGTTESNGGESSCDDSDVVIPADHLVATVRGEPPDQPPELLAAFITPELLEGLVDDWRLSSSVTATPEPSTLELFEQWRAKWIRTCVLESLTNIRRLHDLVTERQPFDVGTVWYDSVGRLLAGDETCWVSPDDLRALHSDCYALREMVRQRNETGFGIVDATPGRDTRGFAQAWARPAAEVVVAQDAAMTILVSSEHGLVARRRPEGSAVTEGIISSVRISVDTVSIECGDDHWELPMAQAAPVTWLVPGSTHWRVREVPEVIIWAETFAELTDCCEEAQALARPIQLSKDSPIRAISAIRRAT